MNGRMSKKLHKEAMRMAKANWIEYVEAICQWPFTARWRFAWQIVFHAKKWRKPKGRRNISR